MTDKKKFPSPEEIQKEFEDFFRKRFGGNVQVMTQPMGFPTSDRDDEAETLNNQIPEEGVDKRHLEFDLTPKQVKAYLDRFVIKQDEAKKALAIAVCDHYNHVKACLSGDIGDNETVDYAKQNVLLLGPTGVGKSYLIRQVAKLIGVPFVKADATRFTETGYVGSNADDLVKELVRQADGDLELAQYGIIYLDEADKLAGSSNHSGRDVSGRGVQFNFLKLMEETDVDLRGGNDMASQMQAFMDMQRTGKVEPKVINTKHILFIVSGAFTGIEEIIAKRLNTNNIGFSIDADRIVKASDSLIDQASTKDFIEYGFEPEFVGRLPIRVACHHLSTDDLEEILSSAEGSIVKQYKRAFDAYGIAAEFTEDGMRRIAEKAHEQQTGARALMTVCEQSLRNFKFELPSTGITELTIDRNLIDDPAATLEAVLADQCASVPAVYSRSIQAFEKEFEAAHNMQLKFSKDAIAAIGKMADSQGVSPATLCKDLLAGFEHGLKLIEQNTSRKTFLIPEEIAIDPKGLLERWIRESYQKDELRH